MKIGILCILALLLVGCKDKQVEGVDVRVTQVAFEPSDEFFINPHKGLQSFNGFNPSQSTYASVAYFRAAWADLEPEEGKYAFDRMDELIRQAQRENQKIAFRLQVQKIGAVLPDWLKKNAKGTYYTVKGKKEFVPDYDDPYFLDQIRKLITAFGNRYNGNPAIDHVDIGMVGEWGEWHFTSFDRTKQYISRENKLKIVDWYINAFDQTQLIALINDKDALEYAVSKGAGWRADSWGDYGWDGTGSQWNHMEDMYPQVIRASGLEEVWMTSPVALETSGNIDMWHKAGMSDKLFQQILDWALTHHATFINNKSAAIPDKWKNRMMAFNQKLGYRLELKSFRSEQGSGSTTLLFEWENTGVAPLYFNPTLWVEFCKDEMVEKSISQSFNGREWLPGRFRTEISCPDMDGVYELRFKLTTAHGEFIHIASQLEKTQGMYRLCTIK